MTTQIAVKLPDELVGEVDRLVARGAFASRSQAVRSSLDATVRSHRSGEVDRSYRDSFGTLPETDQEIADATRLAAEAINDEPWERWW